MTRTPGLRRVRIGNTIHLAGFKMSTRQRVLFCNGWVIDAIPGARFTHDEMPYTCSGCRAKMKARIEERSQAET